MHCNGLSKLYFLMYVCVPLANKQYETSFTAVVQFTYVYIYIFTKKLFLHDYQFLFLKKKTHAFKYLKMN